VVDLVGVEHVALGTDFPVVKDLSAVEHIIKMTLDRYPAAIASYAKAFGNDVRTRYLQDCSSPEQIPAIAEALQRRGWKHAEIDALLGQNYLRVLQSIWKSRLDGAP
jgi:membrane dipeptidase